MPFKSFWREKKHPLLCHHIFKKKKKNYLFNYFCMFLNKRKYINKAKATYLIACIKRKVLRNHPVMLIGW